MLRFFPRLSALMLFLVLTVAPVHSQTRAHEVWYFGNLAGLDFSGGNPVAVTNSAMNMFEGCSSVSDSLTGSLLFYSDGITVWDRNHNVMPNGTGLMGNNSSSQSAMIVPSPAANGQYYLFTVTTGLSGLRYSIVDMTQNGGLGAVTTTKNILLRPGTTEQQAAIYHQDCNRVWIMCHGTGTSTWYAFLLSATGITGPFPSSGGGASLWGIGQMKFSPDGSRVAVRRAYNPDFTVVCDFDNTNGTVSNCIELNTGTAFDNYGLSFSPNSNLLYICSYNGSTLSQFDLLAGSQAAIQASRVAIGSPNQGGSMQNGPDGRLYISPSGQTSVHRVNSPNVVGTGAGFQLNAVSLAGRQARLGLPNLNEGWYATTPCSNLIFDFAWNAFSARVEDATVFLDWEIGTNPSDLDHFLVQRSSDNVHWGAIENVPRDAGIEQAGSLTYATTDLPQEEGRYLYRLRKVGQDGTHAYSETREVSVSLLHPIQIFPNPVARNGRVQVRYTGTSTAPLSASLHTAEGRLVRNWDMSGVSGTLDTRGLAPGMYLVQLHNGVEKWWNKLVIE
ncbi:MAG: T9SS type A sorting domain-containing protein [Bacteroidota bacterium]